MGVNETVLHSTAAAAAYCLQSCLTLHLRGSPGQNSGVGCHALLQGIFLTQGSNPGLLHCGQVLYH